ncbi:MAG: c-type cytochrome [Parasphingorhabdus sp.]|uniref:c-type cytochrome n=1 Tax=Parasphingorhabdus sp. TaxID=2709688 RepID=UPI003297E55E
MKAKLRALSPCLLMALAACGSDPAPEPTEQIIVREPGAQPSAPDASQTPAADEAGSALAEAGKQAFNSCIACHTIKKGDGNRIGPNLNGIIGQAAGAVSDFRYSAAMTSSGITWSKEELDSFLANPAAKIPGTTMMAGAVSDADQRAAIIAYIEDSSAN